MKCNKSYKYYNSTSAMISHLRSHHYADLKAMENSKTQNKRASSTSMNNSSKTGETSNDLLILSMSTSNVPFRFVRNYWFQEFCRSLDPDYSLPSPDAITRKLGSNAEMYIENVKDQLKNLEKCIISFDGWDKQYDGLSIYACYLYFVDENFNQTKLFLGARPLESLGTADNIGDLITGLLKDYGVDFGTVLGGITDGAANLTCFLKKNEIFHIHCLSHSAALIIKNAANIPSVKKVIDKTKRLAEHLSRSKADCRIFKERSTALNIRGRLPLPFAETRWGGSVMLAESYLTHYQSIRSLNQFQKYLMCDAELKILEKFVFITKPYLEAITTAEADSTFCSQILPQYAALYDFIISQNQRYEIVKQISSETLKRFSKCMGNTLLQLATFCDPRYAYMDDILFNVTWEDVEKQAVMYCDSYKVVQADGSSNSRPSPKKSRIDTSFLSKFLESKRGAQPNEPTKMEILSYESMVRSGRPGPDCNPLHFWKTNSVRFPKLSLLARHVLSCPQSSAQVERLFSRCGQIVSSLRNRITAQTMNNVLLNASLGILKRIEMKRAESGDEESDDEEDCFEQKIDDLIPTKRCRSAPR